MEFLEPDTRPMCVRHPKVWERARGLLNATKAKLPKLTKKQQETIMAMMVKAYLAAKEENEMDWCAEQGHISQVRHHAAVQGVVVRRSKSKRSQIAKAFEEATAKGIFPSPESLAKRFKVSRATVYRSIGGRRNWPKIT